MHKEQIKRYVREIWKQQKNVNPRFTMQVMVKQKYTDNKTNKAVSRNRHIQVAKIVVVAVIYLDVVAKASCVLTPRQLVVSCASSPRMSRLKFRVSRLRD